MRVTNEDLVLLEKGIPQLGLRNEDEEILINIIADLRDARAENTRATLLAVALEASIRKLEAVLKGGES